MAWCPFAVHKPLPENSSQGTIAPRAVVLHTAVSGASSLYDAFGPSELESHFYVANDGNIEQYMDTTRRADANYNANGFAVSIETQDDRQIKPWTEAQVNALVRLVSWICDTHRIPKVQIPTWNGAGIGWHVMFGAPGPWTPVAKVCPGAPRIDQSRNVIIPRVAAGNLADEDEMQESDFQRIVNDMRYQVMASNDFRFEGRNFADMGVETVNQVHAIRAMLASMQDQLTEAEVDILAAIQADANDSIDVDRLADALVAAMPGTVTPEQVTEAVRKAFERAGAA